jgi:uncharacterized protein YunC (DUF1805 family)
VNSPHPIRIAADGPTGRIVVADSYTYCDARVGTGDVYVGGSFFGAYCAALALRWGAKALIGHAAGIGKDQAGISGLDLCQRYGVPAAACETRSARIGEGESLWQGAVGHLNPAAAALGVYLGQAVREAAEHLLAAPAGRVICDEAALLAPLTIVEQGPRGGVFCLVSLSLLDKPRPGDVFCVGSHAGSVLHVFARAARPKGVIANDAGLAKDDSGSAGLAPLAGEGIAAAAVSAATARIGDPLDTYRSGIIAHANAVATQAGIQPGMTARDAARRMLER